MTEPSEFNRPARSLVGLCGLTLLPLWITIDTLWATADGWSLASVGGFGKLALLLVLFALMASFGLLSRRGRRFYAQQCCQLWLMSGTTLVALLVAEFCVRSLYTQPPFHCRPPGLTYEYEPDSYVLPGVFGATKCTTNSDGVRGPELTRNSDAYRILCLGGGSTECRYLDDSESWSGLLQAVLNEPGNGEFWVGSAGVSDFATGHHARFLTQSSLPSKMDCVVLMVGANDFLRVLLGMDAGDARPPLWIRSKTVALARQVWNGNLKQGYVFDREGRELIRRRLGRSIPARSFNLDLVLEAYAARLERIVDVARSRQLRVVFVSQPVLWADFLSSLGDMRLRYARMHPYPREWEYLTAPRCRQAIDRYNETLASVCWGSGVEFVDAAGPMSGVEYYFYDDFHLNESGCQRLASILADWFLAERTDSAEASDSG